MASPPSFGLGGSTNHSLRDVGKAEPRAEVDRPIASQGINVDMRSLFELPVTQNPHTCSADDVVGHVVDALLLADLNVFDKLLTEIHWTSV